MEICADSGADADAFAVGVDDAQVVDLGLTICLDSAGYGEVADRAEKAAVGLELAVAAELAEAAGFLVLVAAGSGAAGRFEQADLG